MASRSPTESTQSKVLPDGTRLPHLISMDLEFRDAALLERPRRETMSRLPIPSDPAEFDEERRAAVRHILETRKSMPPPSSCPMLPGKKI